MHNRHRFRSPLHAGSRYHVGCDLDDAGVADSADVHDRFAARLQ